MANLITATIYKVGETSPFTTAQSMSFPVIMVSIRTVSFSVGSTAIHSVIYYLGERYYASETEATLVTAANAGGGSSFLVYAALLTQEGTSAPVPTILENTIGDIVWSYGDFGFFPATLAGAFPEGKVAIFIGNTIGGGNNHTYITSADTFNVPDSVYVAVTANGNNDTNSNGILTNTPVEIRVYS